MSVTPKLGLPIVAGTDFVTKESVNQLAEAVDASALPVSHAGDAAHWQKWAKETAYSLKDVVRLDTCPSWGFLECTQAGTTAATAPNFTGAGEGAVKTDGSTKWTLRRIGSGGGGVTEHGKLSGRDVSDSHPIEAITGLQTALNNLNTTKADKTDLHTHDNKDTLDKLAASNGRLSFDGNTVSGVEDWAQGKEYPFGFFVAYNANLYECKALHTAGTTFDETKFEKLSVAAIPNWISSHRYRTNEVVCEGNNVLRCRADHVSAADFSADSAQWEIISGKGAILPDWQPASAYALGEAVVVNDVIYKCIVAHTSSATFAEDMAVGSEKWRPISGFGTAESLMQSRYLGQTVGQVQEIVINKQTTFCLPPIEVLKFSSGDQDKVVTLFAFNLSDEDAFLVDGKPAKNYDGFVWDGNTVKPQTLFPVNVSAVSALEDGKTYETDLIDSAAYKSIFTINLN